MGVQLKEGPAVAKENGSDPGEQFRELVTQWERNINSFANQVMGTETFSKAMQDAQRARLGVQQALSDLMARYLAAVNMPSRDDVIRIGERLQHLEKRLTHIESLLDSAAPPADASTSTQPPRTRRPPPEYLTGGKP